MHDKDSVKKENYRKGRQAEALAAEWLIRQGYRILERNYRFHRNEIDLIAMERDCLVFIEVKARSSTDYGYGFQAVDSRKQELLRRVATAYLLRQADLQSIPCRFDVVSVDGEEIRLFRNAF